MTRYRALLLDADDTVFDFKRAEREAYRATMVPYGLEGEDDCALYHKINAACWRALERGEITQERLRVARFEALLEQRGVDADPALVARAYSENLGMQGHLIPGALEAVREIAEKMPIAIVTNGISDIQRSRMSHSPIREYVRCMVISQEVGAAKPDPRMVFAALEALGGLPPGDALMAGDSTTSDMLAANRAGVDFCWYNPAEKPLPEGMRAEYMIDDIGKLPGVALME